MAKYKVKVNPAYPADSIGDEVSGLTFTKNDWTEVNGTDWKRLKESKGRLWDELSIPRLIAEGEDALGSIAETYPDIDRQHVRQLIRNAQKDISQNKPPANARKLFKYLREIHEASL